MRGLFAAARVLAAALIASPFLPTGARAESGVPPHQIFQAMLAYADEGRFDRVTKILERSGDLVAELEGFSGEALAQPLRAAIAAKDAWGVQSGILRLTFQHMRSEFSLAARGGVSECARSVRLAYLDFLFLRPRLAARSPANAAEAESLFREIYEGHELSHDGLEYKKFERIAAICAAVFEKV